MTAPVSTPDTPTTAPVAPARTSFKIRVPDKTELLHLAAIFGVALSTEVAALGTDHLALKTLVAALTAAGKTVVSAVIAFEENQPA